jgi:hypothetical protein
MPLTASSPGFQNQAEKLNNQAERERERERERIYASEEEKKQKETHTHTQASDPTHQLL